ncbi:Glutamate 5-kinase / RNA-binding C- terminal domain PUA [invertebrate metagenome]|uniref:Glutamate 5-kinase / RNA-binding C- terminal domain PUA n=1 Tax=invertebrate metagenome TaxID=1711999 RepID=A0A484H8W9_9ZZZZ
MDSITVAAAAAPAAEHPMATARRVVLKVGSTLLVDRTTGALHRAWLNGLVEDIVAVRQRGQDVVVVTSGAVALGRRLLNLGKQRLKLGEKQAAAAAGQISLAHAYQAGLAAQGLTAAHVLLTLDDSENRHRYLNARNTFETLFRLGAVPVVNENDTVATQELRFGDNDRLAARVAAMIAADVLILFSDIDGLYTANPHTDPTALFVPKVQALTPAIESMAGASTSLHGSGGMVTKLMAARICMNAGCHMAIAPGRLLQPLQALKRGGRCTWFIPTTERHPARKRWIAGALRATGALTVDEGAVIALKSGSSLLPAGVIAIDGHFSAGETVLVRNQMGKIIARGLIAYSSHETFRIMGRHTSEIMTVLGYRGRDELIHRDNLALD